ncbi:MAG: hypothetical protein VW378_03715 [bacterium]
MKDTKEEQLTATEIYRNLALYTADFISINFAIPFDLTNIEEKKVTYEEFVKQAGSLSYTSLFNICGLPFLGCINQKIIINLNNIMLGTPEEMKESKKENEDEEENLLTVGQKFVGKTLSTCITNNMKQHYPCNFLKSQEKLSLFKIFFNNDKVLTFNMTAKINDEDMGTLSFCHIENFFDLLPNKLEQERSRETNTESNENTKDEDETNTESNINIKDEDETKK